MPVELPQRYKALSRLGKGGGGEVWEVQDKHTGTSHALKLLFEGASERQRAALVREAVALSALEGLGLPRILQFGRLARSGRLYLVRELVRGDSLERLIERRKWREALQALVLAADQLTVVHRSGLLHGDFKPANVIVTSGGAVALVDLGLSTPWREAGARAEGLTPRYAAPELFRGEPLTVRGEIYALGVALDDIVGPAEAKLGEGTAQGLRDVVALATHQDPARRPPSADELASAVRAAAGLPPPEIGTHDSLQWPVVGVEDTSARLLDAAKDLGRGAELHLVGPKGSGRTLLLRRLGWTLGIEGYPVGWLDPDTPDSSEALESDLAAPKSGSPGLLLVDDAEELPEALLGRVKAAQARGVSVVAVRTESQPPAEAFPVPALDRFVAVGLLRRAVPSLPERVVDQVLAASECRPGELRRLVKSMASDAVVRTSDVAGLARDDVIAAEKSAEAQPTDPLSHAVGLLDRGRYRLAQEALAKIDESAVRPVAFAVARARVELGLSDAKAAASCLQGVRSLLDGATSEEAAEYRLVLGRTEVASGEYVAAVETLASIVDTPCAAEALAFQGLALSYLGQQEAARKCLEDAVARARATGLERAEGIALVCLGRTRQRADDLDAARAAYVGAIEAAERADDAATLATAQINLGGLLKMGGETAEAISQFEAAVDMGRRSGNQNTVTVALLNLVNLELFLGRLSHVQVSVNALEEQRDQLTPVLCVQIDAAQAELADRSGRVEEAVSRYRSLAESYRALDRLVDAAEARLEGVRAAAQVPGIDLSRLRDDLGQAEVELEGSTAHRALRHIARARVEELAGDERRAREEIEAALDAARQAGQREWLWQALAVRAELEERGGQPLMARRDREEALAVVEQLAARLPRDLREVYWNDARRRELRTQVHQTHVSPIGACRPEGDSASLSSATSTSLEQRLARILEINSELAGELDVERLAERITEYAVRLVRAERGFMLLVHEDGSLRVHALRSRSGDEQHVEFSRSIAETVINSNEPLVSLSARDDLRMAAYASVHQLMLQSVACVPIRARSRQAIGALYLETRLQPGAHFEHELPALQAFADQMAIALANARLINENASRANELREANEQLELAQQRLRELLGDRTAKLKLARERLRETRDVLYGHFGYHGMVGTSAAMRAVYSLVDRLKDTDVPVLITGESGTGKEMAARALHASSGQRKGRFVAINCGAIPEHLLESELFGCVRGAFTGADRDRKGLLREAEGGTVLLDEIGEMPQKMQAGLLRVLQDGKVRPVGGLREEAVNLRMLFATNKDLGEMVRADSFREDLYYRIHVVELRLPPLRERVEDIPQLVDHFLSLFSARYKRERKAVSRSALRRLCDYEWPGNVRQLEHVLLNAWVLSDRAEIESGDLDMADGRTPSAPQPRAIAADMENLADSPRVRESVEPPAPRSRGRSGAPRDQERDRILRALEACNWNRLRAAEQLGMPRRTLYRRLKQYKIQ